MSLKAAASKRSFAVSFAADVIALPSATKHLATGVASPVNNADHFMAAIMLAASASPLVKCRRSRLASCRMSPSNNSNSSEDTASLSNNNISSNNAANNDAENSAAEASIKENNRLTSSLQMKKKSLDQKERLKGDLEYKRTEFSMQTSKAERGGGGGKEWSREEGVWIWIG